MSMSMAYSGEQINQICSNSFQEFGNHKASFTRPILNCVFGSAFSD
jgi:hypothetical protein